MTQEDKLRNFYDLSIESASRQRDQMLADCRATLEADFEAHRSEKEKVVTDRMKAETTALSRELKRDLSDRQNRIRQNLAKRQREVKEEIFANVADKLSAFRKTPEYHTWLFRKVRAALAFAGKEEVTIYVDPADETYTDEIHAVCGVQPVISNVAFGGGIRAVIRSRNILIDNSFATLMAEAKENFTFDGGNLNG
ncbi:MAG: V-type ATP synthase subunit E [Lachnospiraceae bacterium]|nr:V-type ATP synthase subunit E [Lachnospiraceae bacterium]